VVPSSETRPKCLPAGPWESPESRDDRPACAPRPRTGRDESRARGRRTRGGRAEQPGSRSRAGRTRRRDRPDRDSRRIAGNLRCAGLERTGGQPCHARPIITIVVSSASGQSGARHPVAIGGVDGGCHAGCVAARIGSVAWWDRAATDRSDSRPRYSGHWADAKANTKAHDTARGSADTCADAQASGQPAPAAVPRQRNGATRTCQGCQSQSAMWPREPAATAPAEQRGNSQHLQRMGMADRLRGAGLRRCRVRPGVPPDSIPPESSPDQPPGGASPEGSDIGRRASLGGRGGPPINNHLPGWSP
jgi:hypothetical protein